MPAEHPAVPTIIMTGTKDLEIAFAAVRQSAQDYLFKGESSSTAIVRSIRCREVSMPHTRHLQIHDTQPISAP